MNEKLKFIFLFFISLIVFIEGSRWGFWLMNQPSTIVFYLGLLLALGCGIGLYLVSYQLIKQIINKK
jgi:hypothetical protein